MILIDTTIAIDLRDGDRDTEAAILGLGQRPSLSLITYVELEGGVHRDPSLRSRRRLLLDRLLSSFTIIALLHEDVHTYGRIVADRGFDRRRILDRLIAAQCLVRRAPLITRNARDFHDIEGLRLIEW